MVHENQNFEQYVKLCGGRYSATVFVAMKARQLAEKYGNIISHAEALTWILSGKIPDCLFDYKSKIKQRELRPFLHAKEYLDNVIDVQVRESVWNSLIKSRNEGHLIYHYEDIYDKDRQARVRILSKKLWYEMKQEEYN